MRVCEIFLFITTIMVFITMSSSKSVGAQSVILGLGGDCTTSDDCSYIGVCHKNKCHGVCNIVNSSLSKCAKNAFCAVYTAHSATCQCNPGYKGDPYSRACTKGHSDNFGLGGGCETSEDCSFIGVCHEKKCHSACRFVTPTLDVCAKNASCTVYRAHYATCKCNPGFGGDPYGTACLQV